MAGATGMVGTVCIGVTTGGGGVTGVVMPFGVGGVAGPLGTGVDGDAGVVTGGVT